MRAVDRSLPGRAEPTRRGLGELFVLLVAAAAAAATAAMTLNELVRAERFFAQAEIATARLVNLGSRLTGAPARSLGGFETANVLAFEPVTPRADPVTAYTTIRLGSADYLVFDPSFDELAYAPTAPGQAWPHEPFWVEHVGRIGMLVFASAVLLILGWLVTRPGVFRRWEQVALVAVVLWAATACLDHRHLRSEPGLLQLARQGDVAGVDALLADGADPDGRSIVGDSALHLAAWAGDEALGDALLAAGADVDLRNDDGSTPLAVAIRAGHLTLAERLLDAGAHPDRRDFRGRTALRHAYDSRDVAAVRLLLEHGADIGAGRLFNERWNAPLIEFITVHDAEALRGFLATAEALRAAVRDDDVAAARSALAGGASPNLAVTDESTVLQVAARKGRRALFELLREHGGLIQHPILRINHQDDGGIALAARQGRDPAIIAAVSDALPELDNCQEHLRRFLNQATRGSLTCPRKRHPD